MITTLEQIRAHSPCTEGWIKLLSFLGKTKADNEPLPLSVILESNGLDDTLWCFRAVRGFNREQRLFAVWCARQVEHLMTDRRSLEALAVAERYANGLASAEELGVARSDAHVAYVAYDAARDAYDAARDAYDAAVRVTAAILGHRAAAWDAYDAAGTAAAAAAWAAAAAAGAEAAAAIVAGDLGHRAAAWDAASGAAWDAASDAARDAARATQIQELKRVLACTEAGIDPYPPKE